jgi:hypothetical protein
MNVPKKFRKRPVVIDAMLFDGTARGQCDCSVGER